MVIDDKAIAAYQSYLDRLIRLSEQGKKVDREINLLLTKINKGLNLTDKPALSELEEDIIYFPNVQYMHVSAYTPSKATITIECNGKSETRVFDDLRRILLLHNEK